MIEIKPFIHFSTSVITVHLQLTNTTNSEDN